MKRSKTMMAAVLVSALFMSIGPGAYPQEDATVTDAQKNVVQPARFNGIITQIGAAKDDEALRDLIADAFSESGAFENYEKFVADAKAASAEEDFNNKDYLNYAIARARIDQLSSLSKNNDVEAGRLYMSVNDKYFSEAMEYLDKVAASAKSKSLLIDNNLLKFMVLKEKEKLQSRKSDETFDAIASQIAKYSDDAQANKKELENIFQGLKKAGLEKHAIKLKILYASKVDPGIAREILEEIRKTADSYFAQNNMKDSDDLYEQYLAAAPAYYNKGDMAARVMEIGEKYYTSGKFRDAKKYYSLYIDKYPDLPPADYGSYKLALSYYYMKDQIMAISQLEGFLEKYKNSAWFDKAFETLAKVYYENLPRDKAIESLQSLMDRYYRKNTGDYAQVLMAMLYYRAKNYDTAEDKLKKIEPASRYSYPARMIIDDIKEIKNNNTAPAFGTDATETYKIWDPYQDIEVKIVPMIAGGTGEKQAVNVTTTEEGSMRMEVNKGAKIQFVLEGLVDEDKFNEYTIDKDDQSRLPKMIKEETEKDLLSLHWAVDGGDFADDKETDLKIWRAPNEPGTYKLTLDLDDLGLVRVPNKGVRKDSMKNLSLSIVVK